MSSFSLADQIRPHFPALSQGTAEQTPAFFDGAGGTQVPVPVIDAVADYLAHHNANSHGAFRTSEDTDEIILGARARMADFLGAASPREIVFGANMTTLTFALSRALGAEWRKGDELVVTELDHAANVAPWRRIAQEREMTVRTVPFDPDTLTLDYEALDAAISPRTRLVAVGYASNAVGTINGVERVVRTAGAVGALCFVDAVHYAPHRLLDVRELGCDFLACSAYKFFGPHQGILWGRRDLLERLHAYKVRPAPSGLPSKFETGTQSHEGQAGTLAAIEYLQGVGRDHLAGYTRITGSLTGRRQELRAAMLVIQDYEQRLSRRFLQALPSIKGLRLYGIAEPERASERVPTFALTLEGHPAQQLSDDLARRGYATWAGHYYALALVERLDLLAQGGMLRIGAAHYNTVEELDGILAVLAELAA